MVTILKFAKVYYGINMWKLVSPFSNPIPIFELNSLVMKKENLVVTSSESWHPTTVDNHHHQWVLTSSDNWRPPIVTISSHKGDEFL